MTSNVEPLDTLDSEPELLSTTNTMPVVDSKNTQSQEEIKRSKSFTLVNGSKLYVISINDKPKFYVTKKEEVYEKVQKIMKYLTVVHPDYVIRNDKVGPNTWQITRTNRWFIMSYDEVIHTIRCDVIRQIEFD